MGSCLKIEDIRSGKIIRKHDIRRFLIICLAAVFTLLLLQAQIRFSGKRKTKRKRKKNSTSTKKLFKDKKVETSKVCSLYTL